MNAAAADVAHHVLHLSGRRDDRDLAGFDAPILVVVHPDVAVAAVAAINRINMKRITVARL